MHCRKSVCALGMIPLALGFAHVGFAQQPGEAEKMKSAMEKMMAAMTPGEAHKELARSAGTYDIEVKIWWGGPGTPPITAKGKAKVESILDGRFVMETLEYEMPVPTPTGGMETRAMRGLSITGYNVFRNVYETTYCDNLNTSIVTMAGTSPPGSNKIYFYGTMDEPMLDLVGRTIKAVTTKVSEDKHTFELYDLAAGENYKVMEVEYARK